MGKLHTLRRAVERDPEKWFQKWAHRIMTMGALRDNKTGEWRPYWPSIYNAPYQKFVKHVLKSLGYNVD